MRFILGLCFVALGWFTTPVLSHAQQTSARGMTGNMELARIQQAIAALKTEVAVLTKEHQQLMACLNRKMAYAPTDGKADNDGCIQLSSFKLGKYVISQNDKIYKRGVTYTASSDMMVLAQNNGTGNDRSACYVHGYVDGQLVAASYAKKYTSFVAFPVPKGSTWKVDLRRDSWCTSVNSAINTITLTSSDG